MLVLTDNATTVVKGFAEQIPEAAGLRITGARPRRPPSRATRRIPSSWSSRPRATRTAAAPTRCGSTRPRIP